MPATGMYVKWGGFDFEPGEATISSFSIKSNLTNRGLVETQNFRFDVDVEICAPPGTADPQQYVQDRLAAIHDAIYGNDQQDFGLMNADDSPTHHYLESRNPYNLTGNQIVGIVFPNAHQGEFVDGRMLSFIVMAEVAAFNSVLLDYEDSIIQNGNGGADYAWQFHPLLKRWFAKMKDPATPITYTHQGRARTLAGWYIPPPPYYTQPWFNSSTQYQKIRHSPTIKPRAYWAHQTSWRYVYTLPTYDDTIIPIAGALRYP